MISLWELAKERPWSISGVELRGDNLSRSVYLDESGTDIHSHVAVVAAVIVNTDQQLKAVEKYLYELIEELVPPELQNGFFFHGKDLFHGWCQTRLSRTKQRLEKGSEILRRVAEVPGKFDLPIAFGYVRVRQEPRPERIHGIKINYVTDDPAWRQSEAYLRAVLSVENYMRVIAKPDELAKLIAEDEPKTKSAVEEAHRLLMGQNLEDDRAERFYSLSWSLQGGLPLDKIYGSIAWEKKTDTYLLQLADTCAYVLHRFHEGKPHNQPFVDALTRGKTASRLGNSTAGDGGNGLLLFGTNDTTSFFYKKK